jgi:proline iminopeptidase
MKTEGYLSAQAGELYYQRWGEQQTPPLVCVHGGPGFTSYTLEPLFQLAHLLPVVCYDQAGCGRARRSGGRKSFTVEGFIDELETLRHTLGFDTMHLLGHSFGGLIIGEYAMRYPKRVASVIFSSASIDIPRWVADGQRLLSQLPLREKMILREGLKTGAVNSPEFLRALDLYYARHVNGTTELPESVRRSIEESDDQVYQMVWGPNELLVTGTIRDYSLTPRLSSLNCPALFICGRFDEATPEAHQHFAAQVPGGRYHVFEHSAHNSLVTEEAEVLRVVGDFLRGV